MTVLLVIVGVTVGVALQCWAYYSTLTATAIGDCKAQLNWSNQGCNTPYFAVARSTTTTISTFQDVSGPLSSSTTSYVDTVTTPGLYYYVVAAVNMDYTYFQWTNVAACQVSD